MKRYNMFVEQSESIEEGIFDHFVDYFEDINGDWIRYEDYEAKMSAMCEADSNAVLGEEHAILSIDDMKCCGNCHHRESMDNGDDFIECCSKRNSMASWQVCDKWRYDKVSEKHRGGFFA